MIVRYAVCGVNRLHVNHSICFCTDPTCPHTLQESTAHQIIGHFAGEHADLVVCDGAPDGIIVIAYCRSIVDQLTCQM